jgi:hypothetical protein
MSTRVVAGIILITLGLSAVFLVNLFVTMMIGEINRGRQDPDVISYFAFRPAKMLRIFREYRRLYPGGKLHIYAVAFFGVQVVCLVFLALFLSTRIKN